MTPTTRSRGSRGGDLEITCEEWAEKLGTITYEVTCQVNARVARVSDPY